MLGKRRIHRSFLVVAPLETILPAYEKGFNVITLKDCCATQSTEAHLAATDGTFGMFSTPLTAEEFAKIL